MCAAMMHVCGGIDSSSAYSSHPSYEKNFGVRNHKSTSNVKIFKKCRSWSAGFSEASWSGSTFFPKNGVYPGLAQKWFPSPNSKQRLFQFQITNVDGDLDMMRGYKLLEREAEEVVKCVRFDTEEDVVRILLRNSKDSRELCTVIVSDGSTALHALAQLSRPSILQVTFNFDLFTIFDLISTYTPISEHWVQ